MRRSSALGSMGVAPSDGDVDGDALRASTLGGWRIWVEARCRGASELYAEVGGR